MKIKSILLIVFSALMLILLLTNLAPVEFRLLFWKVQMPMIIYTVITLLIGFSIGITTGMIMTRKESQAVSAPEDKSSAD
ncbi:MAG: LapA family protein [Candidatus Cloacimonetes bacterium]|nr:LapA family protein [Candidatus Cloacimonadota bacterium]